jgi:hypothetical protein
MTVQTMGEIKLIGFLQFIHPKYTNLKKLTIELRILDNDNGIVPTTSQHVVPYVNVEKTELTISTMTPEVTKGYDADRIVQSHMMSQLTSKHVQDITLVVSNEYENMLSTMQKSHTEQITNLISTQQSQATEIANIKDSENTLKNELKLQIHDKIEKQTLVLTSLAEIVQNMQNKDRAFYAENAQQNKVAQSVPILAPDKEPAQLSNQDLSYSDRDEFSNNSDHSDTIQTETTVPNTVTTDTSQEYKIVTAAMACSNNLNDEEGDHILELVEIPPTEIQYKS